MAPPVLVPVGRHLFAPEDIVKLASTIPAGTKTKIIGRAGLDTEGIKVAVLFTPWGDHFVARTAIAYEWDEGLKVGADVTFQFP